VKRDGYLENLLFRFTYYVYLPNIALDSPAEKSSRSFPGAGRTEFGAVVAEDTVVGVKLDGGGARLQAEVDVVAGDGEAVVAS
jgi:hypothetical protein